MSDFPAKLSTTRRMSTVDRGFREMYDVQSHGYLEGIEIRPRIELPNMDASMQYRLEVVLRDPHGNMVPLEVFAIVRDVG